MVKPIDYYEYWNKNRVVKPNLLAREKVPLKFMKRIMKPGVSFLDAGCGNGDFILEVMKRFPKTQAKGIDYSDIEVKEARKKGLDVIQGDFGEGIKFKKDYFDIIYTGEVIEHLYNPDFYLEEINRVLKDDGFVIITTPNLCAWFNRILMPLGIQPLFLEPSTKSKLIGAGPLRRFKKEAQPVGHIRIFTLQALKDLLHANGFKILDIKGAIYDEGFPKKLWKIDGFFNKFIPLCSNLIILARKVKGV